MTKINDSAGLQSAYSNVTSAGVDASSKKINTIMGNNVMNQGDALNTFLGKNGIDTSSNSTAGKLLASDYTAINSATQSNDASAYAKATAQLATDLNNLTGASVTSDTGGLDTSSLTPGGGVSDAQTDVDANALGNPPASGKGNFADFMQNAGVGSDNKSHVNLTKFPGSDFVLAQDTVSGKVAAFNSSGTKQNLPDWATKANPTGTLVLHDGSRIDLSKGSDGKSAMTAVSGTQISQNGKVTDDASAVAGYLGKNALPTSNLSVAAQHQKDDKYGFATLTSGSGSSASYKNNLGESLSASDIAKSDAPVAAALNNALNAAPAAPAQKVASNVVT